MLLLIFFPAQHDAISTTKRSKSPSSLLLFLIYDLDLCPRFI